MLYGRYLFIADLRSIDPAGRIGARRRWGWNHQAQTLQKQYGALRGASPDELATFALAILHVDVAARILQTAILELAIHVDAIIKNDMLILEGLIFKSIHKFNRVVCRFKEILVSQSRQFWRRGRRWNDLLAALC